MKAELEVIKEEMDNQVGLYDGIDQRSGVGVVIYNSFPRKEFYCGYSEAHKINFCTSTNIGRHRSRENWHECAVAVLDALSNNGDNFFLYYCNHNGFIIKEGVL